MYRAPAARPDEPRETAATPGRDHAGRRIRGGPYNRSFDNIVYARTESDQGLLGVVMINDDGERLLLATGEPDGAKAAMRSTSRSPRSTFSGFGKLEEKEQRDLMEGLLRRLPVSELAVDHEMAGRIVTDGAARGVPVRFLYDLANDRIEVTAKVGRADAKEEPGAGSGRLALSIRPDEVHVTSRDGLRDLRDPQARIEGMLDLVLATGKARRR